MWSNIQQNCAHEDVIKWKSNFHYRTRYRIRYPYIHHEDNPKASEIATKFSCTAADILFPSSTAYVLHMRSAVWNEKDSLLPYNLITRCHPTRTEFEVRKNGQNTTYTINSLVRSIPLLEIVTKLIREYLWTMSIKNLESDPRSPPCPQTTWLSFPTDR